MNKEGFLKYVEAAVAVLIILGVVLVVYSGNQRVEQENLTSEFLYPLLDEIAKNPELRSSVLACADPSCGAKTEILDLMSSRILNPAFNYDVRICGASEACGIDYPDDSSGDLFTVDRIVSVDIDTSVYNPKKVKLFLWKKKG
tara:strand:+ start:353 stop:781 length:429 start_codon:yes stop_codon:yes gene_type:complete